jgi:hypothetical protein
MTPHPTETFKTFQSVVGATRQKMRGAANYTANGIGGDQGALSV